MNKCGTHGCSLREATSNNGMTRTWHCKACDLEEEEMAKQKRIDLTEALDLAQTLGQEKRDMELAMLRAIMNFEQKWPGFVVTEIDQERDHKGTNRIATSVEMKKVNDRIK